ncbi:alpha/beta fold hydrolase [Streptomyces sp. NBC_00996]|uniref:alpha/beta fold hydrolase n=1 Tax=Streptomyces sp. NBC_00996 TaxID=2903710 RepID=UPI003863888F|nr:alpha/beta hydrolase [Streptomyces sp. NBC_00996]
MHVEPRALYLLCLLVEHRDRVVPKSELLDEVWGDRFVSEAALTTALRTARLAVGDTGSLQQVIRTVHRRGYQFVAPVTVIADGLSAGAGRERSVEPTAADGPVGADRQTIRFCRAEDGARIAHTSVGSGPPLLKAANWMTHLDLEWTTPVWSHWLRGLARNRRLVRYDERGCGLSDWAVPGFTFSDWVDDLETVVDAVGLDRFPLLGVSQGGAVAVAYAVRHPERVSRLILAGAYARGRQVRARNGTERDEAALDLDLARVGWIHEDPRFLRVFASQFLPEGTPQEWDEFTAFQRQTTSSANGVRFLEEFARIDVSDIAHRVACPTLIVHSRDDERVPVSQASELAALIPDSRLVVLKSRNHLLTAFEPAWDEFLAHIDAFLAE